MSKDGSVEGLASSMGTLALTQIDLSEGEVNFIEHAFSENLLAKFSTSLKHASELWNDLKLKTLRGNQVVEMPMAMGFLSLAQRLTHYVNPQQRKAEPSIEHNKFLFDMLNHFTTRLGYDDVHPEIKDNKVKKQIFGQLLLMFAFISYEKLVLIAKKNKVHDKKAVEEICKEMGLCANATKILNEYIVPFEDDELNNEFHQLHKEIIRKLYILKCQFNPNYIGFKELEYHVARKNKQNQEYGGSYHGEVLYNMDVSNQLIINPLVIATLLERCHEIRFKQQPRTQFIVDINGQGHANVLDIGFNHETQKFEIISIEPAKVTGQLYFIIEFIKKLGSNHDIVAIQADLLKDTSSCYTFSLALSSQVAKMSFDSLKKCESIATPLCLEGLHIEWKSVTTLGQKVVMMGQSQTEMKQRLKTLLPQETEQKIAKMVSDHIAMYQLEGPQVTLADEPADKKSYIHARRHHLKQRTKQNPYSELSVEDILTKTKAKTPDQALRRLACGYGAKEWMEILLEKHPESVDKPNGSGETALYWAYQKQKASRARLLVKKGAKQENVIKKTTNSI